MTIIKIQNIKGLIFPTTNRIKLIVRIIINNIENNFSAFGIILDNMKLFILLARKVYKLGSNYM